MIISRMRMIVVWVMATALCGSVARFATTDVRIDASFDRALPGLAGFVLAACALWAWVVTTVVVAQAVRGAGPVRGVPLWASRAVLLACGCAMVAAGPAQAAQDLGSRPVPHPLDGLPYPDRPTGPAGATAPSPPPVRSAPHGSGPDLAPTYVVVPGDTLWAIAAAQLAPSATDAEVAARTARLHAANRDVIGTDPDVIHPGLRLRAPDRRPDR